MFHKKINFSLYIRKLENTNMSFQLYNVMHAFYIYLDRF